MWIITWTSNSSATDRQQSIAAGVVPQSSCSFSAAAPPLICSSSAAGSEALPLPAKARFIGKPSAAWIIRREVPRAGGAGGGVGAGRRAGAAAEHGGDARHQRLLDLLRADEVDVHVEAAGGDDLALAGDRLGAGADDDVDAGLDVGVAGLADAGDLAVLDADVGLDDPPMVDDQRIGDDGVDGALGARDLALAHAVADHLAAAELHLLAVDGEVLLDLDDQLGVGEADPVADGRPEHLGIGGAGNAVGHAVTFRAGV